MSPNTPNTRHTLTTHGANTTQIALGPGVYADLLLYGTYQTINRLYNNHTHVCPRADYNPPAGDQKKALRLLA